MANSYADRGQVLNQVKEDGFMLHWATRYQDDKEVVLEAVKKHGAALSFASDRLKDDKDVVLAASLQNPEAFFNASDRLRVDDEFFDFVISSIQEQKTKTKINKFKHIGALATGLAVGMAVANPLVGVAAYVGAIGYADISSKNNDNTNNKQLEINKKLLISNIKLKRDNYLANDIYLVDEQHLSDKYLKIKNEFKIK